MSSNVTMYHWYAELVKAKGNDSYRPCWYRLAPTRSLLDVSPLRGPYRDGTDAENAADDEARAENAELTWVN